jgi:hypothetical protein
VRWALGQRGATLLWLLLLLRSPWAGEDLLGHLVAAPRANSAPARDCRCIFKVAFRWASMCVDHRREGLTRRVTADFSRRRPTFHKRKIFQDEFPVTGSKQSTANPTRYFTFIDRLRCGFDFDDLIRFRRPGTVPEPRFSLKSPTSTLIRIAIEARDRACLTHYRDGGANPSPTAVSTTNGAQARRQPVPGGSLTGAKRAASPPIPPSRRNRYVRVRNYIAVNLGTLS